MAKQNCKSENTTVLLLFQISHSLNTANTSYLSEFQSCCPSSTEPVTYLWYPANVKFIFLFHFINTLGKQLSCLYQVICLWRTVFYLGWNTKLTKDDFFFPIRSGWDWIITTLSNHLELHCKVDWGFYSNIRLWMLVQNCC